jgi:hypothetical protein
MREVQIHTLCPEVSTDENSGWSSEADADFQSIGFNPMASIRTSISPSDNSGIGCEFSISYGPFDACSTSCFCELGTCKDGETVTRMVDEVTSVRIREDICIYCVL